MANNQQSSSLPPLDYGLLFASSPEPMIIFQANDPDFTIAEANTAHTKLTGVARNKLIGRNCFELFPDISDTYIETGVSALAEDFRKVIKTKAAVASDVFQYDIPKASGGFDERYWNTVHAPICDTAGKVTHILQISKDVTSEVLAERETRTVRDQLQDALQIGKVGSWVWDIERDVVIADQNLARLFGVAVKTAAKGMSLQTFTDAIHPKDRDRVVKDIQEAIKKKTTYEAEYRTVSRSGRVRWVLARGKIEKSPEGKLSFPGVVVDITERRELQAEVQLARQQDALNRQATHTLQLRNDELESIARTKDEFVALASHQLRTPATAVKQYVGMVLQGYVGDITDMQKDMLEKAFEGNERQIQIINQILNAARVDTGRLVMSPVPIDLAELLRGIADEMRSSLEQRGHAFTVKLPAKPVRVTADLGYLRMAVENLIHNAGIYTAEGGSITLELQAKGTESHIYVTDTGVGIRKADIGKLFAKFSRIHNPLSVQAGGSGIGLYLTAEIIRLHGGKVTVKSVIHKGTTFAISLPVTL